MTGPRRIDTHQHIVPAFYTEWLHNKGITAPNGKEMPGWTPEAALSFMGEAGIDFAILSHTSPGVWFGDVGEAREMARRINEYCAEIAQQHPDRFGFFAFLPLPDVEGSIAEAKYTLDVLGADGIIVLANVEGTYFGDKAWDPLLEVLNERKAIILVHPTELPGGSVDGLPAFVVDFLLDTTRAAVIYARSGALDRYANLKVILSHAGGFLPYVAERVVRMCSPSGDNAEGVATLRKFHFDLALSSSPYALPSLLAFADPSKITYGSDWPFAPRERGLHFAKLLDQSDLAADLRFRINRGNAQTIFTRFSV